MATNLLGGSIWLSQGSVSFRRDFQGKENRELRDSDLPEKWIPCILLHQQAEKNRKSELR